MEWSRPAEVELLFQTKTIAAVRQVRRTPGDAYFAENLRCWPIHPAAHWAIRYPTASRRSRVVSVKRLRRRSTSCVRWWETRTGKDRKPARQGCLGLATGFCRPPVAPTLPCPPPPCSDLIASADTIIGIHQQCQHVVELVGGLEACLASVSADVAQRRGSGQDTAATSSYDKLFGKLFASATISLTHTY